MARAVALLGLFAGLAGVVLGVEMNIQVVMLFRVTALLAVSRYLLSHWHSFPTMGYFQDALLSPLATGAFALLTGDLAAGYCAAYIHISAVVVRAACSVPRVVGFSADAARV